jgi:hypothetical protein
MFNRGNLLQQLGNPAKGLKGFDQVLALAPDDPAKSDRVDDFFARAAALEPGYAVGKWFNTKQRLWDWGNYDDAEAKV